VKAQLPGPTFAAALLFATVLAVWLSILGPLNIDLGELRNWQTLMAAFVALGAAIIAYNAAIQKVRLDREIADREILRKKLSLYLKLEFALQELGDRARLIGKSTSWIINNSKKVSLEDIQIIEPSEIEEAWNYLDVFPMQTIQEMRTVRTSLRKCATLLDGYPLQSEWKVSIISEQNNPTYAINQASKEIEAACGAAVLQLASAIRAILSVNESATFGPSNE
jgi:hypothetical protein